MRCHSGVGNRKRPVAADTAERWAKKAYVGDVAGGGQNGPGCGKSLEEAKKALDAPGTVGVWKLGFGWEIKRQEYGRGFKWSIMAESQIMASVQD